MDEESELTPEEIADKKKAKEEYIKNCIRLVIIYTSTIVAGFFILWFFYWLAKEASYHFFYEDLVRQTIIDMIDPKFLKQQ